MPEFEIPRRQRFVIATFVWRYPQVHLVVGLLGNALFVTGALCYVLGRDQAGVWLFMVGSCGMFAGSLGEVVRKLGRRRLAKFDVDPSKPDVHWSETGTWTTP